MSFFKDFDDINTPTGRYIEDNSEVIVSVTIFTIIGIASTVIVGWAFYAVFLFVLVGLIVGYLVSLGVAISEGKKPAFNLGQFKFSIGRKAIKAVLSIVGFIVGFTLIKSFIWPAFSNSIAPNILLWVLIIGVLYYFVDRSKNNKNEFRKGGLLNTSWNVFASFDEVNSAIKRTYIEWPKEEDYKQAFPEYWSAVKRFKKNMDPHGHTWIGGGFYWGEQGHMITIGSARFGNKGSSLILPNLLSFVNQFTSSNSFIVLDPKGENLAVSGKYLKNCGYNVVAINPFGIPEIAGFGQSGFNVFDTFSSDDPDFDKFADMIANAIAPPVKNSNEHFQKTSRSYISLYIRHLMTQDIEPRNFRTLYKWLRLAGDQRMDFLQGVLGKNMSFDGDIADEAFSIFSQIASGANKEVESTYSTIRSLTDIFKSQQLRDSVSQSDFDVTRIAHDKTAIFVCMNPSDLEDNQAWLRILFGSFIRSLTRNYSTSRKVLMIMDEFPTMGYFREFEILSGFAAGYNITLWPIMQDLTQLKALYPNTWETFVNNAAIRHFSAIGDNFTAEYLSRRMKIINKGTEEKPKWEPIMRPDEIINATNPIFTEIKGCAGGQANFYKLPYWKMPDCSVVASPNPFH